MQDALFTWLTDLRMRATTSDAPKRMIGELDFNSRENYTVLC